MFLVARDGYEARVDIPVAGGARRKTRVKVRLFGEPHERFRESKTEARGLVRPLVHELSGVEPLLLVRERHSAHRGFALG